MAKKLGILALVVCMLLSVTAVASASWDKPVGSKIDLAVEDKSNKKGTFSAENCQENLAKIKTELKYGDKLATVSGHIYEIVSGDTIVDKSKNGAVADKETSDVNKQKLSDYRKAETTRSLAAAEKTFTPKRTGEEVTDSNEVIAGEQNGWKLYHKGDHSKGEGNVYRRTCVICEQYEEVTLPTEHTPVLAPDAANPDGYTCAINKEDLGGEDSSFTDKAVCSVCKYTNNAYTFPNKDHTYTTGRKDATCTQNAGNGSWCTVCGHQAKATNKDKGITKFEEVANVSEGQAGYKLGHKWELQTKVTDVTGTVFQDTETLAVYPGTAVNTDAVGCKAENVELVYVCTRPECDHALVDLTIAGKEPDEKVLKNGKVTITFKESNREHVYSSTAVYKAPDCLYAGRDVVTCANCGLDKVTHAYPNSKPTGHTPEAGGYKPVEGTKEATHQHSVLCTKCGANIVTLCSAPVQGEKDATEHWLKDGGTDGRAVVANCQSGAGRIYECKLCGYYVNTGLYKDRVTDETQLADIAKHLGYQLNGASPSDLKLDKWTTKTVIDAASCTEPGTVTYTCNDCGTVVRTEAVAGAHTLVRKSTEIKDCTQGWVEYWVCSREDCPGVSVSAGLNDKADQEKNHYTATVTTIDGKAGERRAYAAHEAHEAGNDFNVTKEPTCAKPGEKYALCKFCGLQFGDPIEIKPTYQHDYTATGTYVAADCTHPARTGQICRTCGEPKPGVDTWAPVDGSEALGHTYVTKQYLKLKGTEVITTIDCTVGWTEVMECTRCGDVTKKDVDAKREHKYGDEVHKPADCTHNDRQVKVCSICGYEDEAHATDNYQAAGGPGIAPDSLKMTGHKYGDWKLKEDPTTAGLKTKHVHVCENCGKEEVADCSYKVDKERSSDATCVNVAVRVNVCEKCKNEVVTYGINLDPNNHDFVEEPLEGHEPTCTEGGTVIEKCPNCGATGKTKEVKALGHAWERDGATWATGLVFTAEPTCTTDGKGYRKCEFCDYQTEETVIGKYDGKNTAFGHTWSRSDYVWSIDQLTVDVAPTCSVDGKGHYTCADCGYELTTGIPHYAGADTEWGHIWSRPDYVWSFDQLHITTQPTCTKDGEGYYECTDCGRKMVVPVPHYDGANTPYGHAWEHEPWPVGLKQHEDGSYYYECPDCGYIVEAE